jgi:aminopeptidase N
MLAEALKSPDANVRKAALKDLNPVPDALQASVELCLADSSWLNIELALNSLCISFPEKAAGYLEQTKNLEGWRGRNIRMKWLEISIANGNKELYPELISYTGPKFEFETRINAFNTLKKLMYIDPEVQKNARSASQHWNNKLSAPARDYLNYFN